MKKIILTFILLMALPLSVLAAPNTTTGMLKIGDTYLLDNTGTKEEKSVSNATYSESTNTLTLQGINTTNSIYAKDMGTDFKIKLEGNNTVKNIWVEGTTDLSIIGAYEREADAIIYTGKLTLKPDETTGVRNYGGNISIDSAEIIDTTATTKVYAGIRSAKDLIIKNSKINIQNTVDSALYSEENMELSSSSIIVKNIGTEDNKHTGIYSKKNITINYTNMSIENITWGGIDALGDITINNNVDNTFEFKNLNARGIQANKLNIKALNFDGDEIAKSIFYAKTIINIDNSTIDVTDSESGVLLCEEGNINLNKNNIEVTKASSIVKAGAGKISMTDTEIKASEIPGNALNSKEANLNNSHITITKQGTEGKNYPVIWTVLLLNVDNSTIDVTDSKSGILYCEEGNINLNKNNIEVTKASSIVKAAAGKISMTDTEIKASEITGNVLSSLESSISNSTLNITNQGTEGKDFCIIWSKLLLNVDNSTIDVTDSKSTALYSEGKITLKNNKIKLNNVLQGLYSLKEIEIDSSNININSTKSAILIRNESKDNKLSLKGNMYVIWPENLEGDFQTIERKIDGKTYYFSSYALGNLSYDETNKTYKNIATNLSFVTGTTYKVLSKDLKYTIGNKENLEIELEGDINQVSTVLINDKNIISGDDYTIKSIDKGIKVILYETYLSGLKKGTYNLTVKFSNGEAKTEFKVVEKTDEIAPENSNSSSDKKPTESTDEKVENPKTGVGITLVSLISLVGIGFGIYKLKKNHKSLFNRI